MKSRNGGRQATAHDGSAQETLWEPNKYFGTDRGDHLSPIARSVRSQRIYQSPRGSDVAKHLSQRLYRSIGRGLCKNPHQNPFATARTRLDTPSKVPLPLYTAAALLPCKECSKTVLNSCMRALSLEQRHHLGPDPLWDRPLPNSSPRSSPPLDGKGHGVRGHGEVASGGEGE